ncbi:hypothetical protein [Methanococcoides sp. LMO-2]|uniref:NERD domain-containing protein n=1 Tax=Methanococcoides cohabitans TaxID=3136559 RepID=A0ABU9KWM6_9EURY
MSSIVTTKFKKYFKKNLTILFHNVVLQLILTIIFGASILQYIGVLNDILLYKIQIWKIIVFLVLFCLTSFVILYVISKKTYEITRFGLLWKITLIKNKIINLRGPFCYYCDCDISHTLENITHSGGALVCPKCQNKYSINATTIKKIKKDIKQIIDSDLKSNKVLDIMWLFYNFDHGSFRIKNKGVFGITDLNIHVSTNISQENKEVGEYYLGNIAPLESKTLEDNIAKDLKESLVSSNLISIFSLEIPKIIENYYGEEQTVYDTSEYIRAKKDFELILFIDLTYKLEKKQKKQRSRFLLNFSLKDWKAYDYDKLADNCYFKLQKID